VEDSKGEDEWLETLGARLDSTSENLLHSPHTFLTKSRRNRSTNALSESIVVQHKQATGRIQHTLIYHTIDTVGRALKRFQIFFG